MTIPTDPAQKTAWIVTSILGLVAGALTLAGVVIGGETGNTLLASAGFLGTGLGVTHSGTIKLRP